jgi:hypothetical protein
MGAPVRNKTELGTFTTLVVGGVAVLAFILRAIARLPMFGGNWGLDDWAMAAAMVLKHISCTIYSETYSLQVLIIPLTICAYLCTY